MSIKVEVSSNLKPWQDVKAQLKVLQELGIDIGWFGSHYGPENQSLYHAQVAAWNETGTKTAPPRPYFRVGFRDFLKAGGGNNAFAYVIQQVVNGQQPLKPCQNIASVFVQSVKKIMEDWDSPPNAKSTIEQKGFNDPLVETHELIDNLTFKVRK